MTSSARSKLKILLSLALVAALILPASAAHSATKKGSTPNPRYSSIVVDADSGVILHESSADKSLHPASLVKMMTLLMVFERLEDGRMTLNQRIKMTPHAAAQQPSKIGLRAGSTISVKDAIYALVTKSANDIAVAVGEHIGGTESNFAQMMTTRAKELGMTNTRFKNASGLHHPNQVSTARDIAKLSRILINNYPQQYKYFSTKNFSYNGVSHRNHNRLMETFKGMDGIKTGFIQPSGFNLAASAMRGDRRLIAVVFGGRTTQSRNAHVADLLNRGFDRLGSGKDGPLLADAGSAIKTAPIPPRKPGSISSTPIELAMNAAPANPQMSGTMQELAGEGDIDPAIAKRFETGMMAIAAIKGEIKPGAGAGNIAPLQTIPSAPQETPARSVSYYQPVPAKQVAGQDEWSIQVGAFTSRVRSDQALNEAIRTLPENLRAASRPVIVPLKAGDGWVFRARIRGLSRDQAAAACKYFNNCMAISPRAF